MTLKTFTAHETQMICLNASECILNYFQDILKQGRDLEQLQVATFKSFIRRYVGSLEGVLKVDQTPLSQLKITKFQVKVDGNFMTDSIDMSKDGLKSIGFMLANKLLTKILDSTLTCLQKSIASFSPHNELVIGQCREKSKLVEKQLNEIIKRENWNNDFVTNQHTELNSVMLEIEILYPVDDQTKS